MKAPIEPSRPHDVPPTEAWRRRRARGDRRFDEENISAAEAVLTELSRSLAAAAGSRERILKAVEDVVTALNRLGGVGGSLGNFIETQEREELCAFINHAARAAGLDEAAGVDVTEEWREW